MPVSLPGVLPPEKLLERAAGEGRGGGESRSKAGRVWASPMQGTCLPLGADLVITESWLQLH